MKTEQSTRVKCKNLFGAKGWRLEKSLIPLNEIETVRQLLEKKRLDLEKQFVDWTGDPLWSKIETYGLHQARLPEYEARNIPKDLRHYLRGEFDLETRLDLRIVNLITSKNCKLFLKNFLESDHYFIHYPPMIRFKIEEAPSSLVPIHQDYAYNHHLTDFITVWVPLVTVDEKCGGVIVYEGTHHLEKVEHVPEGAWGNKALAKLATYTRNHVDMNEGDILLFPPTLLHESAPHRSSRVRYSVDFRVFRDPKETTKSYFCPESGLVRRME